MILHISHEQSKCSTGFTTLFFHFCSDCECRVPRPPFVSLADIKERTQLDTNAGHAELRSLKFLKTMKKTFVKLRQCQCFCMTLHQGPVQGTGMRGVFGTLMPTDQNHCKQVQCKYGTSQVVIARTLICMPDRINNIWIMRLGGSKRQTPRGLLVRSNEAVLSQLPSELSEVTSWVNIAKNCCYCHCRIWEELVSYFVQDWAFIGIQHNAYSECHCSSSTMPMPSNQYDACLLFAWCHM